jgi:hypothetical protein
VGWKGSIGEGWEGIFQGNDSFAPCEFVIKVVDVIASTLTLFLQSKYGAVDGQEVEKIIESRGWLKDGPKPEPGTTGVDQIVSEVEAKMEKVRINFLCLVDLISKGEFNNPVTPVDYLACDIPIPAEVMQVRHTFNLLLLAFSLVAIVNL